MPIKILISPPASGKTTYCMNRVLEVSAQHATKDIWVLVPDGFQAISFRKQIGGAGGGLGIHVVTFDNMLREFLEQNGRSLPLVPDVVAKAFIRQAIKETATNGQLSYFAAIQDMPGFTTSLQEHFVEFKRGMVFPEHIANAPKNLSAPILEMGAVFDAYQQILIKNGWADPAGLSWLAIEFLENNRGWTPNWPLLVLDGFDSFTKPQLKSLELLSSRVPEILITLPGSLDMKRRVHQRFSQTLQSLCELPAVSLLPAIGSSQLPPPLSHLESSIGESDVDPIHPQGGVSLLEAKSQSEEAREALRWIKAQIVRDHVPPDACAVIVSDTQAYTAHLQAVAAEFGLPLEFSFGRSLSDTAAFAALESLLRLSLLDFPRRLLLDTIRSPFFNLQSFGLSPQTAFSLDLLSRSNQITAGREKWTESLEAVRSKNIPDFAFDEEDQSLPSPSNAQAASLHSGLSTFFEQVEAPEGDRSIVVWVSWVEDLLDVVKFWEKEMIEMGADARSSIRQLLRNLVLIENVVPPQDLSYQSFLYLLMDNANRIFVQKPWLKGPSIKVFQMIEGRGLRHQAVAVLGLSEGIFPRPQKPDPFINESSRLLLGLESAFDQHQFGLFYQSITRADKVLLLTRPYLSSNGESWEPSPFWEEVKKLFLITPKRISIDAELPLSDAGAPAELLAWAVHQKSIPSTVKEDLQDQVERVVHGRGVLANRSAADAHNPYNGGLSSQLEHIKQQYGQGRIWSASRIESYLICPYFFFASKVLELQAPQEVEVGMDIAQRGSIYHKILERVFAEVSDPDSLPSCLAALEAITAQVLSTAPAEYGFRPTALWEQEKQEMKNRLEKTIGALHEVSSGWTPIALEAKFGIKEALPLIMELQSGLIHIRGVIDRVDKNEHGHIRIIDYKTGSSGFGKADLENGSRLQLPIYGLAARDALGHEEPVEGFYWSINAAQSSSLTIGKYGFDNAVAIVTEHIQHAVDGVSRGEFAPAVPDGGCPAYCPAASWCWLYQPKGF